MWSWARHLRRQAWRRPSRGSREPRDRHEQPPARLRIATAPTGTISTARPVAVPAAVHSPAIATVFQQQVGPVQRVVVINIPSCAAVACASSFATARTKDHRVLIGAVTSVVASEFYPTVYVRSALGDDWRLPGQSEGVSHVQTDYGSPFRGHTIPKITNCVTRTGSHTVQHG